MTITLTAATAAQAGEVVVPAAARSNLEVTLYGAGAALVLDRRAADLPKGETGVAIVEVSPQMRRGSAVIDAHGASVLSILNDFNVISQDALLRRSVGREIGVIRVNPRTGEETIERGTLLAYEGGAVARFGDRIETGLPDRVVFFDAPADLRTRPTLVAAIDSPAAGRRDLDLSYLTDGLDWGADYVVTLAADGRTLDLAGRAVIDNATTVAFPDAAVALVAGEVHRAPAPAPAMMMREAAPMAAAPPDRPQRESLGDLHLYTLPKRVTLPPSSTKQVPLLDLAGVPFQRSYRLESAPTWFRAASADERHPETEIVFTLADGKGGPLPAGTARIFTRDRGGAMRLIGEDEIGHTPVGGEIRLNPGRAFDVTATRTQTEFSKVAERTFESAYSVVVKNAKAEPVTVAVVETIPGDWRVLSESLAHRKERSDRAVWDVAVPAGGRTELTFRVRIQQ